MDDISQAKRWMANEDLQKFIRQATIDLHVGQKTGATDVQLNWVIFEFLNMLDNSLRPHRMVKDVNGKWQEIIMPKGLS